MSSFTCRAKPIVRRSCTKSHLSDFWKPRQKSSCWLVEITSLTFESLYQTWEWCRKRMTSTAFTTCQMEVMGEGQNTASNSCYPVALAQSISARQSVKPRPLFVPKPASIHVYTFICICRYTWCKFGFARQTQHVNLGMEEPVQVMNTWPAMRRHAWRHISPASSPPASSSPAHARKHLNPYGICFNFWRRLCCLWSGPLSSEFGTNKTVEARF